MLGIDRVRRTLRSRHFIEIMNIKTTVANYVVLYILHLGLFYLRLFFFEEVTKICKALLQGTFHAGQIGYKWT